MGNVDAGAPRPKALGWQGGGATACKVVDVGSIPIGGIGPFQHQSFYSHQALP